MALLTLTDAELAHGDMPLLDGAAFAIEARERIGLIGRNGSGKSSLLAVIAGGRQLDDGVLQRADGLRCVLVDQEPSLPSADTLRDSLAERGAIRTIADERERWQVMARLEAMADRLDARLDAAPERLSGGERKRAALALALALEPDLLLLDEPTNHLDIDAITLLEDLLARGPTLVVVTHDRRFLDRVATRIVELDRGTLRSYPGNFADYERFKADQLAVEAEGRRRFDRFWQQEEAWIRKGIEARRTRNQGRVRRLDALRREREQRRERQGDLRIRLDAGSRSGRRVAELTEVGKRFDTPTGERWVIRDFSTLIQRGDRIGLIGPNGAGKTTLLRLMLGSLAPDEGRVELGTGLRIAYFDQMRAQLDPQASVAESIAPGSEWIEIGGQRRHVMSYLGDFLFSPRRAGSPVASLSGGERNRLLLARLFAQPANLIVLDEPTNDLDMESLELLESTLQDYEGTLLLVSHDRAFLDNVVTQTIAAEGDGRWREYVGGYEDWLRQRPARALPAQPADTAAGASTATPASGTRPKPRQKLNNREQRELDALPGRIEALEAEQAALQAKMTAPDYFRNAPETLRADQQRHDEIEHLLVEMLERWEALEARQAGG
ncbi:MAG: ATP-binding cassette domain-containing protein [Burkholderiaceae bacterium]|nr:ATP-binding cassette domain-containing protein [Burkholderiaceae bacterium]